MNNIYLGQEKKKEKKTEVKREVPLAAMANDN
jgi:hypothetical protein